MRTTQCGQLVQSLPAVQSPNCHPVRNPSATCCANPRHSSIRRRGHVSPINLRSSIICDLVAHCQVDFGRGTCRLWQIKCFYYLKRQTLWHFIVFFWQITHTQRRRSHDKLQPSHILTAIVLELITNCTLGTQLPFLSLSLCVCV